HRFEVHGLDRLDGLGSALLVGYHGRPIAHDLCMLSVTLHERYGYVPHGVVDAAVGQSRAMKWGSDDLGFVSGDGPAAQGAGRRGGGGGGGRGGGRGEGGLVTGDGPAVEEAVRRGELHVVEPGGTREGCRSFRHRYRVDWGERTGYLRLALRHRLPIVPIAA